MVFVIPNPVRGDIVHFLLWQGRLKNGIPEKGPPLKPPQECKLNYHSCPPQTSHPAQRFPLPCFLQNWREEIRRQLHLRKLQPEKWGDFLRKPLSAHIHPELCTGRTSSQFPECVMLASVYNSGHLSASVGLWEPLSSSQLSALVHFKWLFDILISKTADWSH